MIRAVLFDAHGTLIELAEPLGETYARIAAAHGVRVSAWRIGDAFRRVLAAAEPAVFPDAAPEAILALEREWWGNSWAERATQSQFAAHAIESGHSNPAELARIGQAWRDWASDDDGWLLMPHAEVLARA